MPVNQSKLRLAPTLLSQLTGMFKLAIVLQLDSKAGTVFLFNEPTDNGLWGPWRDMTQIALSSDWD